MTRSKHKELTIDIAIFLASATLVWLVGLHFKHVLFERTVYNNTARSYQSYDKDTSYSSDQLASSNNNFSNPAYATEGSGGCGCPGCCAIN